MRSPSRRSEPPHVAEEINLPVPIRRRALEERVSAAAAEDTRLRGLLRRGQEHRDLRARLAGQGAPQPVPRENVVPADLTDWRYRAPR